MVAVHRRLERTDHPGQGLDRHLDARGEATGGGEQHAVDVHRDPRVPAGADARSRRSASVAALSRGSRRGWRTATATCHAVMASRLWSARQPSSSWARLGIGVGRGDVAGAPGRDLVGDVPADGGAERPDHLEHAGAPPGAEVPHVAPAHLGEPVERGQVAPGEVDDVDVVADAGAVGGVVVVAEDLQLLPAADGHLGDERHQVVRDALRVLTDAPGPVGAHGVEVAQEADRPAVVGGGDVGEHLLDHQLRAAVRVGRLSGRRVLAHRDGGGIAVDRGRRREHDGPAADRVHRPDEVQRAAHVVAVVADRLGHRLTDRLEPGEVDDGVGSQLVERRAERRLVEEIDDVEGRGATGELAGPLDRRRLGVGQVVEDRDVVTGFEELDDGVAADVAGAAGHEDVHGGDRIRRRRADGTGPGGGTARCPP